MKFAQIVLPPPVDRPRIVDCPDCGHPINSHYPWELAVIPQAGCYHTEACPCKNDPNRVAIALLDAARKADQ